METMLSIVTLAIFALVIGAVVMWRKGGSRKRIALMLLLAAIMAGNVALLTWPNADGKSPLNSGLR